MTDEPSPVPVFDPAPDASSRRTWLLGPWLGVVLGGLCFLNALPNEFVYDDVGQVVENERIRSPLALREIWLTDWTRSSESEQALFQKSRDLIYRPMLTFSLALNHTLHGLSPAGFRLGNILLHMLVCYLLWALTQRLFADRVISTVASVLFAAHPVHCEAVIYIVGRSELLAAAFLLGGVLVLLGRQRIPGLGRALAAAPLFFLALLSKESAVCYVAVAALVMHHVHRRRSGQRWRWWLMHLAVLLIPLACYLPLRYAVLGGQLRRADPYSLLNPVVLADGLDRAWMSLAVLGHYVRLLLYPVHLSADYGLAVLDPQAGPGVMAVVGLATAAALLLGLVGYVRREGLWRRVALLSAFWIASYLLISNTVLLIAVSLAERLVYLPSIAALVLAAALVTELWRRAGRAANPEQHRRLGMAVIVVVVAGLAGRSVIRNSDWATGHLFVHDAESWPQSAQLAVNAGVVCANDALRVEPPEADEFLERAAECFARSLSVEPEQWQTRLHLADVLARLGRADEAIGELERAVNLKPRSAYLRAILGTHLCAVGRPRDGVPHLERAVSLVPDTLDYQVMLGQALGQAGEPDRAIKVLQDVVNAAPDNVLAHRALVSLLLPRDPASAVHHARQAARVMPESVELQLVLAQALMVSGQREEGVGLCRQIIDVLPPQHPVRGQLEQWIRQATEAPEATQPANEEPGPGS